MATGLGIEGVTLAIIIGVLAAIVYSLRVLMLLERRIARMDMNLLRLTEKVLAEEMAIEREEKAMRIYFRRKIEVEKAIAEKKEMDDLLNTKL